jgi:hypothetical protein
MCDLWPVWIRVADHLDNQTILSDWTVGVKHRHRPKVGSFSDLPIQRLGDPQLAFLFFLVCERQGDHSDLGPFNGLEGR